MSDVTKIHTLVFRQDELLLLIDGLNASHAFSMDYESSHPEDSDEHATARLALLDQLKRLANNQPCKTIPPSTTVSRSPESSS